MKILIAEDEGVIAMQYKKALEHRKHEVVLTLDAEQCIKAYRGALKERAVPADNSSPFDVVVIDQRMPGKTGVELAKEIVAINPKQRIIFATAYSKEIIANTLKELNKVIEVLQKPFPLSALVDQIEDKEIPAELEKLNMKLCASGKSDPSDKEFLILTDSLSKIQKHGIWYVVGNMVVG